MNMVSRISTLRQLPALVLLVAIAIMAIRVVDDPAFQATAIVVGIYATVAVPLGLLFGYGGVLSLAQGSFAAIGGYTAAVLSTRTEISPYLTVLVAVAASMLVAAIIARPILRLSPLSLVIATLALGSIVSEVSANATDLTAGRVGMTGIEPLPGVGFGFGAYLAIWGVVLVLVIVITNFITGSRGRSLDAIRHDPTLAKSVGVAVSRELSTVFVFAAGASGMAGWFYVHYVGFIAPESLSFSFSTAVLLMVVVGGRKSVLGPVVGAVFYVTVRDYLPGGGQYEDLIFGLLLAAVLVFLPGGLASLPGRLWRVRAESSQPHVSSGPNGGPDTAERVSTDA